MAATARHEAPSSRRRQHPPTAPAMAAFVGSDGTIAVDRVAESFGLAKGELALTLGIAREAVYKTARAKSARTQGRLRELLEIVERVTPWAGGRAQALAWYRSVPIAAFGDRTAEALVKSGEAAALRDYLDHLALGGFA